MRVENVYKLMQTMNSSSDLVKEYGNRILRYIYHDVYGSIEQVFIDAKQETPEVSPNYKSLTKKASSLKNSLPSYLDNDKSIISYFDEMIKDEKDEFIELFVKKIEPFLTIIEKRYYQNDDYSPINFSFNLYAMLKAYHEHKDDFELFSMIVDDCSFFINTNLLTTSYYGNLDITSKKELIDCILEAKCYRDIEKVRSLLKEALKEIGNSYLYSSDEIPKKVKSIKAIELVYADYNSLKEENPNYNLIDCSGLANDIFRYVGGYRAKKIFYSKILLFGERYSFIERNLTKHVDNSNFADEVFKKISSLDYHMFEYLNEKDFFKGKDSFVECIKNVFDSDTYYELDAKITAIKEASQKFSSSLVDECFNICTNLNDIKYKLVIDGEYMSYDSNTMNKVDKPFSITKRMKELYSRKYPNIDINLIFSHIFTNHSYCLYNFTDKVNSCVLKKIENMEEQERQRLEKLEQLRKEELDREEQAKLLRVQSVESGVEEKAVGEDGNDIDSALLQFINPKPTEEEKKEEDKPFSKFKSIFGKKG